MKKIFKTIPRKKTEGITLISVVLISVLILTAVMGIANVLVKELSFSTDTLNGERAYFAAESAVEEANLQLLANPIFHGDSTSELTNAKAKANIDNIISTTDNFSISLAPNAQQTIRLQKHSNGLNIDSELPTLKIIDPLNNQALKDKTIWTIRCKGTNDNTVSIQGNFNQTRTNLKDWEGKIDDSDSNTTKFNDYSATGDNQAVGTKFWNTGANLRQPNTCTLSLENLSDKKIVINVSDSEMAPEVGTVTATGTANNRTKKIQYQTSQSKVQQWINWGVVSK